jgi:hypothetical protein
MEKTHINETKSNTELCFKLLDFYNRYDEGQEYSIYKNYAKYSGSK